MNRKYKNMIKAVFTSGIALIINCMINLILTPYITKTVGTDAYGFVSLSKQLSSYAFIITAAINSFASRYIVVEYHKHDREKANMYFSSAYYGDIILATAILVPVIICIFFLEKILNIPPALVFDVKILFSITIITFWITSVFTVFSTAALIKDRLDLTGLFKTLSYIVEASTLVICYMLLPTKILYVGIAGLLSAIVVAGSNYWMCTTFTSSLHISRNDYKRRAVFKLMKDGVWTSLNSLGDALNTGLDLIVCDLLLTAVNMGQIAIAKTFHSLFGGLFVLVGQAFQPMFLKSYANNDKETLLSEMKFSMKISGLISNVVFAGFFALGMAYYRLWIPNEDIALIYALTVINNIVVIPGGSMQPLYYIYVLTLKKKLPTIITILGGLFNVLGMYVLIKYTSLGVYAVMITTAVIMCLINFISNPLYMAHVLKVPWQTFYPNILKNVISCASITAVFKGITYIYNPNSWITLILAAMFLGVIGVLMHLYIVCNKEERNKIYNLVRKKVGLGNG